jgi:hypothetical protein
MMDGIPLRRVNHSSCTINYFIPHEKPRLSSSFLAESQNTYASVM